ncbi:DgyrCDS4913 [Dimorphilus gyrociliatus]|uniref:DgyrCDS4913 n=1 Tax=Dimorphilus gyrociliatus TaxID=2664684 RepID=A0A7I8VI80_9ANNE|nr:DgyrCDS4913 [Dimorphilus gyrociliatus]
MGNELGVASEDDGNEYIKQLLLGHLDQERRRKEALTAAVLLSALTDLHLAEVTSDNDESTGENLPPGFADDNKFQWDPRDCSPNIKLSNNYITATKKPCKTKTTDLVRGTEGYTSGVHIFKIFCPKSSRGNISCVIGLSCMETPLICNGYKALVGGQETSVGWDIVSRQALYNSRIISSYPENKPITFEVPESLTMIADLNRGVLIFKSEDEDYGVCLSGLDDVFCDKNIKLFPAVSMTVSDCEVSICKPPMEISEEKRKVGIEKVIPAWALLNTLMIKKDVDECDTVVQLFSCFRELTRANVDNLVEREIVLQIMVAFDKFETVIKYLHFLWKNIRNEAAARCFFCINTSLLSFTNRCVSVPLALASFDSFSIIAEILTELPSSILTREAKTDSLGCLLGAVYNCSRVPEVRQSIANGPMLQVLYRNLENTNSIPLTYVSSAMSLGNILSDEKRKSFNLDDLILKQIVRMIKCGAEGKTMDCNGQYLVMEEMLETIHAFMDCSYNCNYFIKSHLIHEIVKILQRESDSRVVELALACLNKAFTQILGEFRSSRGPNVKSVLSYLKINGLKEVLEKKKDVKSENYSAVAETCLIKLSEIFKGRIFDDQFVMCYCQFCHVQRNDNEHYNRGNPSRRYALPIGWCRLGIKPPPQVKATKAFERWYRAYYKVQNINKLSSILRQPSLVMSGHRTIDGQVMPTDTEGLKRILLSPTIRYCDYYTKATKWDKYEVKSALQVLVEPNTFKTQKGTTDESKILDPLFANEEIEWSVDRQGTTFVYDIDRQCSLVKVDSTDSLLHDLLLNDVSDNISLSDNENAVYRFTCTDAFKWDNSQCSENLNISSNGSTVTKAENTPSYDIVRSVKEFKTCLNFFKVKWPKNNRGKVSAIIGISSGNSSSLSIPSDETLRNSDIPDDSFSCGWDIVNNTAVYNEKNVRYFPSNRDSNFAVQDEFLVILDLYSGILAFEFDDEISICFGGLNDIFSEQIQSLYLTAALYSQKSTVTVENLNSFSQNILPYIFHHNQSTVPLFSNESQWKDINSLMINSNLKDIYEISEFFLSLTSVCQTFQNDQRMYLIYLRLMIEFNDMKSIVNYHKLLWRRIHLNCAINCFLTICHFVQNTSYNNSLYSSAFFHLGYVEIIEDILETFIEKDQFSRLELRLQTSCLAIIYSFSKVSFISKEIKDSKLIKYLLRYINMHEEYQIIPFLSVMSLSNLLSFHDLNSLKVEDTMLTLIMKLLKNSSTTGNTLLSTVSFHVKDILQLCNILQHNYEYGMFFVMSSIIDELAICLKKTLQEDDLMRLILDILEKSLADAIQLIKDGKKVKKLIEEDTLKKMLKKISETGTINYATLAKKCQNELNEYSNLLLKQKINMYDL